MTVIRLIALKKEVRTIPQRSTHFTACVIRAGRREYPSDSFATTDWTAHQGAPSGGLAG